MAYNIKLYFELNCQVQKSLQLVGESPPTSLSSSHFIACFLTVQLQGSYMFAECVVLGIFAFLSLFGQSLVTRQDCTIYHGGISYLLTSLVIRPHPSTGHFARVEQEANGKGSGTDPSRPLLVQRAKWPADGWGLVTRLGEHV